MNVQLSTQDLEEITEGLAMRYNALAKMWVETKEDSPDKPRIQNEMSDVDNLRAMFHNLWYVTTRGEYVRITY